MQDILMINSLEGNLLCHVITLWYLCLELKVEFIVYFFKISVLVVM